MTAQEAAAGERIVFAHNLRGVAVAAVLSCHALFMFWIATPTCSELVGLPPAPAAPPAAIAWLFAHLPINLGFFGVALFFLISGFVIPFSFKRQGALGFLCSRFFRIWPTYACGLAITLVAIGLARLHFRQPFALPWGAVVAHLLMVRDVAGRPMLDGIVWTLEIEVRFYLLCALLAASLRGGRSLPFVLAGVGCAALGPLALWVLPGLAAAGALGTTAVMIPFLLIGTVFHHHHQGRLSSAKAGLLVAVLAGTFVAAGRLVGLYGSSLAFLCNYLGAVGAFATCYGLRGRLGPSRVLGWLADISYPLYVIHGFAGYCFMRVALEYCRQPYVVLGTYLLLVLSLGALVHHAVELPTNALGKKLASRAERRLRNASLPSREQPPSTAAPTRRAA